MRKLLRLLFRIDHLFITADVLLLIALFAYLTVNISFLNPVARSISNFRMTDVFYDIHNSTAERDTSELITLVDITNVFDRGKLADIIDEVQAREPAAVGIDIIFDGLRDDSLGNERLIETACSTTSPTIWACKLSDWDDVEERFTGGIHSFFSDILEVDEGFTNVQRDTNGGTVRTFGVQRKANKREVYSLPARVAQAFTGDSLAICRGTDITINYQVTEFPIVQHDSIAAFSDLIRGHIVLLGATEDVRDMHYTPLGSISGLHILAYTIQTFVQHQAPTEIPTWQMWLFTILVIWLSQVLHYHVIKYLNNHRWHAFKYMGSSGLGVSIVTFCIMVLLVGISYWLYALYNTYLNTAWAIMGTALLSNARQVHALVVNLMADHLHWSWIKKSLYLTT